MLSPVHRLLIGVAVAGVLAGCVPEEQSDHETFVEDADAVCAEHGADVAEAGAGVDPEDPDAIAAVVTDDIVPALRAELDALRELDPPRGDADDFDAMLAAFDRGISALAEQPEAVLDPDSTAFAEANRLARDLGFEVCGRTADEEQ